MHFVQLWKKMNISEFVLFPNTEFTFLLQNYIASL